MPSEGLRVLLVANTLPPTDISGVGEQVLQLAAGLRSRGHEVEVLGRGEEGARGPKLLFPIAVLPAASAAWVVSTAAGKPSTKSPKWAATGAAAVSRANVIFWGCVMNVAVISMFSVTGAVSLFEFAVCVVVGLGYMLAARFGAAIFRRTKERDFRRIVLWMMLVLAGAGFAV